MKKLGLYVHIPFCIKKCNYCNFVSFVNKQACFEKYCDALVKEIQDNASKDYLVDTIYIGGGTPNVLKSSMIGQIINAIKTNFNVDEQAEITIEVNPNSINEQKAKEYLSFGINRISVGVQSLNNACLKTLGRLHSAKQAIGTLKMLKQVGFTNISCDLMLAIPHLHTCSLVREVKILSKYCNHISCYSLILEEDTALYNMVQKGQVKLIGEKKSLKQYKVAEKILSKLGFIKYEVSNFALNGFRSKHNLKYWDMQEYLGFGVSSHSFFNGKRLANPENLQDYFALVKNGEKNKRVIERVGLQELKEETIMLSLRKTSGLNIIEFNKNFNCNLLIDKKEQIKELLELGLIEVKGENLYATKQGFYVLNQIILKLID